MVSTRNTKEDPTGHVPLDLTHEAEEGAESAGGAKVHPSGRRRNAR